MSPAPPTQPDGQAIASQLLASLRKQAGVADLEYARPPHRITGGFETLIYGFQLSNGSAKSPEHLNGPLILRLFNNPGDVMQSRREAAFQNALANLGYPVPRVVARFDTGIDSRPFNIMERVAGAPLIDVIGLDPAHIEQTIDRFATIHTRLHEIPVESVIKSVANAGFPQEAFSLESRINFMQRYFSTDAFAGLRPGMDWLTANKPAGRETPVVCHGDFHPGNIMVNGSDVTGVIDWPGAAFADPEFDVATSLVLIRIGGGLLSPEARPMLNQIADIYLRRYGEISPVSAEKVDYYEALRCFRAFTRATALRTPGISADLLPRDHYPWAGDFAITALQSRLRQITGIDLPLPG